MHRSLARATASSMKAFVLMAFLATAISMAPAQQPCAIDLANPGQMKDIVSNALHTGVKRPEADVRAFLKGAESAYASGPELLRAAAQHFGIEEAALAAEVERFRHCNCTLPGGDRADQGASVELSTFARDVTVHVALHELGHALIREFDLPVLGNEETMADAFATHWLTTFLPDRALAVLEARTRSLMIEAKEVPRAEWPVRGEHDNDARRAFQIAALALAADAAKYASLAPIVEMSDADLRKATDYGAEIHRAWRRILAPLRMPEGAASKEARVLSDTDSGISVPAELAGLAAELESIVTRFDWHSLVTIRLFAPEGRAGWSRSTRTVTIPSEYIRRFIAQGKLAGR